MQSTVQVAPTLPQSLEKLTARERQVLELIVKGQSNVEIASTLYLSCSTVKSHVRGILNKLGVNRRLEAAIVALRAGAF
jgi:two-component system, NarL family, response regulator LiaR